MLLVVSCLLVTAVASAENKIPSTVCVEEECVSYAKTILSNMDQAADPCVDFYKFACGGYDANNPIPEEKTEVSALSHNSDLVQVQLKKILEEPVEETEPEHFKTSKKYYQMCVDVETLNKQGLRPMQESIDAVGGWPVVTGKDPTKDWKTVVLTLRNLNHKSNSLFELYVEQDFKNSTRRLLTFDPPPYKLKQENISKGKADKNVKAYFEYMIDIAMLFGANETMAKEEMDKVIDLEIELAKATKSTAEKRVDFSALYNIYTLEKLEEEFPKFPWREYVGTYTIKNFTVTSDRKILLTQVKYTKKMLELLEATEPRVLINYIIWHSVLNVIPHLNEEARNLDAKFQEKVLGQFKPELRFKQCLNNIENVLLPVVSSLYVRKYFDKESKKQASLLVKYLKKEFKDIINETDWLDEDKITALEKVDALIEFTGFPDEIVEDDKIDEAFGSAKVIDGEFLKSYLLLDTFNSDFLSNRVDRPVNKTDWIDYSNSAIVNAYYLATANAIVFPAAILQGPYFHAKRPKYVNFATIGSVIGHEMSHGFDQLGHQFDKNGEINNWWSETANKNFEKKKQCIIDQYNKYEIFDGTKLNGEATVGENLADFGGQKMAYYGYQHWLKSNQEEPGLPGLNYTNSQLYWITGASIWCSHEKPKSIKFKALTDSHPPSNFRVIGALQNLEVFSKDFQCPKGSPMNPENKCKPW